MKKLLLSTLLALMLTPAAAQPVNVEWSFPLYFETGDGLKDTVWFAIADGAYEDWGPGGHDTIFGESIVPRVQGDFHYGFACGPSNIMNTMVYSVESRKYWTPMAKWIYPCYPEVGSYPLKISWDQQLLTGNKFPFPPSPTPGAPNAVMMLFCYHPEPFNEYCNDYIPYVVCTNDPLNIYSLPDFLLTGNELVISGSDPVAIAFEIQIVPYGNYELHVGRDRGLTEKDIQVYPNPFHHSLTIDIPTGIAAEISMFDLHGKRVGNFIKSHHENTISIGEELPSGMYLLKVSDDEHTIHKIVAKF
jgi:Secretion system C-terminal sorting domain